MDEGKGKSNFRISQRARNALKTLAESERRTMAAQMETMIKTDYNKLMAAWGLYDEVWR